MSIYIIAYNYITSIKNIFHMNRSGKNGDGPTTAYSALLLTADRTLAGRLKEYLIAGGYLIIGITADLGSLFRLLFENNPDLVLIDTDAASAAECGEAASIISCACYTPVILLATPGRGIRDLARISEPAGIVMKPPVKQDFLDLVSRILRSSKPFSGKSRGPKPQGYLGGSSVSRRTECSAPPLLPEACLSRIVPSI